MGGLGGLRPRKRVLSADRSLTVVIGKVRTGVVAPDGVVVGVAEGILICIAVEAKILQGGRMSPVSSPPSLCSSGTTRPLTGPRTVWI